MHKMKSGAWWSRGLGFVLAILMAVQLAAPVFAQPAGQPDGETTIVTEPTLPAETQPEETQPAETQPEETQPAETQPEETQPAETQPEETQPAETQPVDLLAAGAPVIPGYTHVTGALDDTKVYMIVSVDSSRNIYAFYPAADRWNTDPGNAIDPNHSRGCPEGTFVAELTVQDGAVTAQHATSAKTPLEMKDLHLTLVENGGKWGLRFGNGTYLELAENMLAKAPVYLTVGVGADGIASFTSDARRVLDFNKSGDPKEFQNNGKKFKTNFWGPGETRFDLYLYTKDGETVVPEVNKDELKAAIAEAEQLDTSIYTEQSKALLDQALAAAKQELDRQDSTKESVKQAMDKLKLERQALCPKDELLAPERPNGDHGVTEGEPFPAGLGGSQTYRIPAITTLQNGWLAAAIDARWDACPDGFGIDTLYSVSKDGGKTWEYSFPNYFNDSVDQYWGGSNAGYATAFIDPVMVQGKDGTIYLMTDLFAGGTYIGSASTNSGYEVVDGVERLAIHTSTNGSAGSYDYYVGDFADGYAPLIARGDTSKTPAYYVDDHYYLYTADKRPMYCQQVGTKSQPVSGKYVRQNVFFYHADLHVRRATYLWLITSNDNGETWSAPTILNPMVRKDPATHRFYGVGPGAGLCMDDGTVLIPCYVNPTERSSFVYKNPDDDTWYRSPDATSDGSSESALVQVDGNTVRQFTRDGHNVLRYTDFKREGGEWVAQEPVKVESAPKTTWNQLSAIRYSSTVNGKPLILVSTASTGSNDRKNGKIYAFNLEDDPGRTMTLIGSYEVNGKTDVYGYSSLTEKADGSIALLYEDKWTHAAYRDIELGEILPNAVIDGKRTVGVEQYRSVADPYSFETLPTRQELDQMDKTIATAEIVDGKVVYTGLRVGATSYVTGGVTVTVKVKDPSQVQNVNLDEGASAQFDVEDDTIRFHTDPNVVDAKITTVDKSVTVTGGQATTGTDANYTGAAEPLAKSLHMFIADGDGYQVFGRDAQQNRVWLDPAGTIGLPSSASAQKIYLDQQADGTFFVRTENRYLAFWRDGKNVFDAGSSSGGTMTPLCKFKLYRPAQAGEQSAAEMPGYVQVKEKSQITDGGLYLLAAESRGAHYVLRPTFDSSKYDRVAKVAPTLEQVSHRVENRFHTLTLTGKAGGSSDVVVGDVVYRVTVNHQHAFGDMWLIDDTHHWHGCMCGEKQDVQEHTFGEWTQTKDPTETESGLKERLCDVCGYRQTQQIPPVEPVPPTTEPVPPTTEPVPPTTEPVPPTTEPVPPTTEPVPPTTEPVPPTTEPVPPTTAPVTPTAKPTVPGTPNTGDGSSAMAWVSLLVMCGCAAGVAAFHDKKKKH